MKKVYGIIKYGGEYEDKWEEVETKLHLTSEEAEKRKAEIDYNINHWKENTPVPYDFYKEHEEEFNEFYYPDVDSTQEEWENYTYPTENFMGYSPKQWLDTTLEEESHDYYGIFWAEVKEFEINL